MRKLHISAEELATQFPHRIQDAAKNLKVSVSSIKKACRRFGLRRWPHQRLSYLDTHLVAALRIKEEAYAKQLLEERSRLLNNIPADLVVDPAAGTPVGAAHARKPAEAAWTEASVKTTTTSPATVTPRLLPSFHDLENSIRSMEATMWYLGGGGDDALAGSVSTGGIGGGYAGA